MTNLCFLIMPLGRPALQRLYTQHVSEVLRAVKLRPQHSGGRHGPDIPEDIWIALNQARVVLAELTGLNANVMYELGIAHTLGKPVVLLTSDPAEKIPFDLKRLRHVVYTNTAPGIWVMKSELRAHLKAILKEYPSGHLLISQIESRAESWATGYREETVLCSIDDLNLLRVHVPAEHLTDRALSYCAAASCYYNSVGNMLFWGQLCDGRVDAASDLVFGLFAQHVRTRLRVLHLLAQMSARTRRATLGRMLEFNVDRHLRDAFKKRDVFAIVRRDFRSLMLSPERRDQMIDALLQVRW